MANYMHRLAIDRCSLEFISGDPYTCTFLSHDFIRAQRLGSSYVPSPQVFFKKVAAVRQHAKNQHRGNDLVPLVRSLRLTAAAAGR